MKYAPAGMEVNDDPAGVFVLCFIDLQFYQEEYSFSKPDTGHRR
jgi:hypothetical protein